MLVNVLLFVAGWSAVSAVLVTRPVSYLKIPNFNDAYGMFRGVADKMTYDNDSRILYIIGGASEQVRVIDLDDPANPLLALKNSFSEVSDGVPTAITFCRSQTNEYLAIAFESSSRLNEGHVELFTPYVRGDTSLSVVTTLITDTNPRAIEFTPGCGKFIVACEGLPGIRASTGSFEDPLPHVDIFERGPTSWTRYTVNFQAAMNLDSARWIYRHEGLTRIHDLEPSDLAILGDNVYVTFGENNAFGVFNHNNLVGGEVIYPLGSKDWSSFHVDTSDREGSVNLATRLISSFYQPESIIPLSYENQLYIASANTGSRKVLTAGVDGVDFAEGVRARLFDRLKISPSYLSAIESDLIDNEMGRLWVSTNEETMDGWNSILRSFDSLHAYGGRSWSIWHANVTNVYDSADQFEFEINEYNSSIFNSQCESGNRSPPQDFDMQSDEYGPKPAVIAQTFFQGSTHIAIGSGTMGGVFIYRLEGATTPSGVFQSYSRQGGINGNWNELYAADDSGTPYVSDMRFIDHPNGHQYLLVLGSQTGALSVQELYDGVYP